jgi:putative FmdB family regulatory protein
MPIYEYQCRNCRNREEFLLPFDHKTPECQKCHEPMNKMFGSYSIQMKVAHSNATKDIVSKIVR